MAQTDYLPDNCIWVQVGESKLYRFYICARGIAVRVDKKLKMSRVPVQFNKCGIATVTVAGLTYALHTLVAREFLPYKTRSHIIHADGNPLNCDAKNLIIKEIKRKT